MDGIPHERTLAKIAVSIAVAIAGVSVFYVSRCHEVEYKMVDELGATDDGREIKIHGWVMAGSIVDGGNAQLFVLQKRGHKLTVVFNGPRSDGLRDQNEVVAHGVLHGNILQADDLQWKCGSGKIEPSRLSTKFE